ncbi:CRISPR-associated endoribonuclease Cas6 [Lysinibacillus sp. 54212]|uniref:CRISPR-associated endoribonuclease Cas6 n=1 Tax=Lysinibacillus sp. 54212 TaxID=3119829 RepID=UPI002FC8E47E
MRIKIHIDTRVLPLKYRMLFLSLIKEAIRQGDEELYHELFKENLHQAKKYSYAVFLKNFKNQKDLLHVEGATLTITSSDPHISVALINGFQQIHHFTSHNYELNITKIDLLKEQKITTSIVKFKTLNTLLLEDKEDKPLLIDNHRFEDELNFVCNRQFESQFGRPLKNPLKILAYNMKKQVIQESNRHADGKTLYYTGQKGEFVLSGDPTDLQLIYQTGLANRKSQGFGTLEVVQCYDESYCE